MKAPSLLCGALLALAAVACAPAPAAAKSVKYAGAINTTASGVPVVVELSLDYTKHGSPGNNVATLTMNGPADVWFGIGFNASAMADLPYTVTMQPLAGGAAALVYERTLGDHAPGTVLKQQFTIVSDTADTQKNTHVVAIPPNSRAYKSVLLALVQMPSVPPSAP